jgi:hypothetical protein
MMLQCSFAELIPDVLRRSASQFEWLQHMVSRQQPRLAALLDIVITSVLSFITSSPMFVDYPVQPAFWLLQQHEASTC